MFGCKGINEWSAYSWIGKAEVVVPNVVHYDLRPMSGRQQGLSTQNVSLEQHEHTQLTWTM